MWVDQVINQLKGDISNRDAFIDAVLKSQLANSPLGRPVRFDDYGNPIYDVYIRKVVKNKDGKYWNVPVQTYPAVSQFWTYKPEDYLKNPPFSRDYQGIKK
jgi:branched-chain amino acid transport system substrate-binding protein